MTHPSPIAFLPPTSLLLPSPSIVISYDVEAVRSTNLPMIASSVLLSIGAAAYLWPEAIMAYKGTFHANVVPEVMMDEQTEAFWRNHRTALWACSLNPLPCEEATHEFIDWVWCSLRLHERPIAMLSRPHNFDGLLLGSALNRSSHFQALPDSTTWHDAVEVLAAQHPNVPSTHLHHLFKQHLGQLPHHPVEDSIRQFQAFLRVWNQRFTPPPLPAS